jgi:aspartyl-tRNA(Asn)/glutamyl-tRNA(Gln) amidotransferase subunit C
MSLSSQSNEELDVEYIARLSRMALSEEELSIFQTQLNDILGYVDQLKNLDVEGIEPTQHAVPVTNVMRPDIAEPWDVHAEAMDNAPADRQGQFVLPRIVES